MQQQGHKFSRASCDNCESLAKVWGQDTRPTDLTSMKDWLPIIYEDFFLHLNYPIRNFCAHLYTA